MKNEITTMHAGFISKKEDQTDEVQGYYSEFIAEMADVKIHHMHEIVAILKAHKKDRSSILGIVKKIL